MVSFRVKCSQLGQRNPLPRVARDGLRGTGRPRGVPAIHVDVCLGDVAPRALRDGRTGGMVDAPGELAPIGGLPAAPLGSARSVSLVLVAPSTETRLNDASAASRSACARNADSTAASVVMKASNVAMFGWIIPDPLHIPP